MAKNNTSAFKEDDTKKTLFMSDKTDNILVLRSYKEITARLLFSIDLLRRNRGILCN